MGVKPGTTGGMFRLNPFVDDIPDRYSVDIDGVRVLVAGAVKKGGAGCYCPENALIRALISHLLVDGKTDLILDMEAGIEHLSRGTVRTVDALVGVPL
jgi:CO dehydrogenase maturation factor